MDVSHLNHGLFTPTKKLNSIRLALQVSPLLHQYGTLCPGMIALYLFAQSITALFLFAQTVTVHV